jgi:hypothetical protein
MKGMGKSRRPFPAPKTAIMPGAMTSGGGQNSGVIERAAYDAAYPRVTDALTLYGWRAPAFELVRAASTAGVTPTTVTLVEALLSALAFALLWNARYWPGLVVALIVTLLSIAALMQERTSAGHPIGAKRFRLAVELVPPAFWWWAWAHGLPRAGHALAPVYATMVLWVVVGGYIADLAIDGLSHQRFGGMSIHAWQPVDSYFRLVAAGRNSNLILLGAAILLGRPDTGLELVAWWTLITLIFHSVRFAQLTERQARREKIVSWLDR